MPIIDLHCDTIDRLYTEKTSLSSNTYHVDLSKMKTGKYLAQWFALFIDSKNADRPLMQRASAMYNYFMDEMRLNKDTIELATSFETYEEIKAKNKMAAFLSLEEGQIIEGKLENIKVLHDLGVRMMTLTWNYENELGYPHSVNKGLTPFGKRVVEYLNDLPMVLDISHLSESAVKEILSIYKKPFIASHANARAVCFHTRNLSDDIIRYIADAGGVIGINLYGPFLDGSGQSKIEAINAHIAHVYKIGGESVLALGTDFDGISCDLEVCNAGEMDKLIDRLAQSYSQSFIDQITYKNAERIIKEILT